MSQANNRANKKITHFRAQCIGCSVCVSFAPSTWEICQHDGRADLLSSAEQGDIQTAFVDDATYDENIKARDNCPTGAIRLE